jgi:hypothetical protein
MHHPAAPRSPRSGTHRRVPGPPPARPANGQLPAESRIVELAAELLDVTNESELEGFLRKLVAETPRNGGRLPADTAGALVAALRRIVERTVPTLTSALGDELDPATEAGPSVAATAARVYGLELEGMSAEDRDYEIARQFLHLALATTARAARSPARAPAAVIADTAVAGASRELAPGLLPLEHGTAAGPRPGPPTRRRAGVRLTGVPPPTS